MRFWAMPEAVEVGKELSNESQSPTWQSSRRAFLKMTGAACVPGLLATSALAQAAPDFWSMPRQIWLQRKTARGVEEFRGVYFADGKLLLEPYLQICRILRDVREDVAVQMSPVLLDILCGVQGIARVHGVEAPLETTSGHRTARHNSRLEGAARASLHIEGRAWDGRMPGISPAIMSEAAKYLRGGGVGLYVDRRFVHVDDGRLRSWRGR